MAYTSDLRLKNLLKDIHTEAVSELKKFGLENKLFLRIFDESSEDAELFINGGLSFKDPFVDLVLGSNDAGWTVDNKTPLVIVEGTFGTERGQFGDGQLNRFSHSASVAYNNFIGVTFVPFKGESYSKDGTVLRDIKSQQIALKYANLHNGMIQGALNICNNYKGKFLIIDTYDRITLLRLLVESVKNYFNIENTLNSIIAEIILKMKNTLGEKVYGSRSDQVLSALYDVNGKKLTTHSRIFTQNFYALTNAAQRDGHGLLGKNLIEVSAINNYLYFAIFIRLTQDEVNRLVNRNSKEFQYIFKNTKIIVKCIDDLLFLDRNFEEKVRAIKDINLFQNRDKNIIKEITAALNNGDIKVK